MSNEILTEHFGFQPISVIDDVINAVNEIMYKCTEMLEQVLMVRKKRLDEEDVVVGDSYSEEDVQKGTAKLESLLEHLINRNYDKLEVYSMRNVLSVPGELVQGGFVRLKHQQGMHVAAGAVQDARALDQAYAQRLREVEEGIAVNRRLVEVAVEAKKVSLLLGRLAEKVRGMDGSAKPEVQPLQETYRFLANEIRRSYESLRGVRDDLSEGRMRRLVKGEDAAKSTSSHTHASLHITPATTHIVKQTFD